MLSELVRRWYVHKLMVRHLHNLFHYLECHLLSNLLDSGLPCFRNMVFEEVREEHSSTLDNDHLKMEGMLCDMTISRENQSSFDKYLGDNPQVIQGAAFSVNVLTIGFWPSYKPSELNLPPEMVECGCLQGVL